MTRFSALVALILLIGACTSDGSGTSSSSGQTFAPTTSVGPSASGTCPQEGEEMETALLYIEHNATDRDTGVHG